MSPETRDLVGELLTSYRIMTIATNRADGWPQATTVSYVSEGLTLYCFIARVGQKFANILRDSRVSIAIALDFDRPENICGLSLAGRAKLVEDKGEYERVWALFIKRFPEYADWPRPGPAFAPMFRIVPELISVLDYSKGFGHSDLLAVSESDAEGVARTRNHDWLSPDKSTQAKVVPAVRPSGWRVSQYFSSLRS